MKFFLAVLILVACSLALIGQTKKRQSVRKPSTIRATVTVNGNLGPQPKLPKETDEGIWNEFFLPEYDLKILFPSKPDDLDYDVHNILLTFQTSTAIATYSLMMRDFPVLGDNKQIGAILEDMFVNSGEKGGSIMLSKKDIFYEGRIGKEIVTEKNGSLYFARFFILNSRLFAISVSVEKKTDRKRVEPWVKKFFDSFLVKVPIVNET